MKDVEKSFIALVSKEAKTQMAIYKMLASVTIAQAIYESNWGNLKWSKDTYNLFKVPADETWNGKCYSIEKQGVYTSYKDCIGNDTYIRMYSSYDECIKDWIQWLLNRKKSVSGAYRYKNLVGISDYKKSITLFVRDGYIKDHLIGLRDPNYQDNMIKTIELYELYKFDEEVNQGKLEESIVIYTVRTDFNHYPIYSDANKENAIKEAKRQPGYKVYDAKGNVVNDPWGSDHTDTIYRVRLSWNESGSQILASQILQDCKTMAERHAGYKVFDESGNIVYNPWKAPEPKDNPNSNIKEVKYYYPGDVVNLTNEPVYSTAYSTNPFFFLTGKFYLFDAKVVNSKTRITKSNSPYTLNGKDPSTVIGFIKFSK